MLVCWGLEEYRSRPSSGVVSTCKQMRLSSSDPNLSALSGCHSHSALQRAAFTFLCFTVAGKSPGLYLEWNGLDCHLSANVILALHWSQHPFWPLQAMTYSCVLCLQHMLQEGEGSYYALKGWRENAETCRLNTREHREHKSAQCRLGLVEIKEKQELALCPVAINKLSPVISLSRVRGIIKQDGQSLGQVGALLPSLSASFAPSPALCFPLPCFQPWWHAPGPSVSFSVHELFLAPMQQLRDAADSAPK